VQIFTLLKFGEAKKGAKREDGCNEQMQILVEEIKEWQVQNPGKVAMPGYDIVNDISVFEDEEEVDE